MNNLLEQALGYHKLGLSVVPAKGKRPAIGWKEFQNRRPTEEEIRSGFDDNSGITGLAVITGKVSGVIVLDIDNGADLKDLVIPETVTVRTGSGGRHYYFKYPDYEVMTKARILPKVDIRGSGGCAILPPATHPNGNQYHWEVPFDRNKLADMPDWLREKLRNKASSAKDLKDKVQGVEEGRRNDSAASLIGKLLAGLHPDDWDEVAQPLIKSWNKDNRPPLPDTELKTVYDSIALAELQSREAEDQEEVETRKKAEKLVKLVLNNKAILFCDQFAEPFIAINGDGSKILKLNSKFFRRWLSHKAWVELEESFGGESIRTAVQILEGKACYESDTYDLQVRVAKSKNGILYDLGNGRIVEVTKDGWKILEISPIAFRHLPHQKSQPDPVKGGDIKKILRYMNIRKEADELSGDLLLATVSLLAGFIPGFAHPVMVLFGPQGSAKTTLSRIFKELIDPSAIKTFTMPDTIRELVQLISHHHFIGFDNLAQLADNFSDSLCRAVTGDGFSKRELYTDDDDIIYEFQRNILLNGINLAVEKPDLLDRSLIIGLERITSFEEEKSFWDRFGQEKSEILGAIFNTIAMALNYIDGIPRTKNVRMADFINWGCAITKALGVDPAVFIDAYTSNVSRQNDEALEASPVATAIIDLLERQNNWQGTPTELLTRFNERAGLLKIDTRLKNWPKDARWLWRRLQEAKTNLLANEITVERSRDRHRTITISKVSKNDDNVVNDVTTKVIQPSLTTSDATSSDNPDKNDVDSVSLKKPNLFGEN